jgi:hypothetical protein
VKTSPAPPLQQIISFRRATTPPSPATAVSLAEHHHRHNRPPPLPSLPSNGDSWLWRSRCPCLQQSRGAANKKRPRGIIGEKQHEAKHFHPISFSLPKMEDEQMKTSNNTRPWLARIERIALIASEQSRVSKSGPPYQEQPPVV